MADTEPLAPQQRYALKDALLGKGVSGSVVKATDTKTGQEVAVKTVLRGSQLAGIRHYVEREIINHAALGHHPHLIHYYQVFLTDKHLCIAMEYANGGDLFEYVRDHKGLKEPEARRLFQQLIVGVNYCHRKGTCNRDIKLENTLLHRPPGLELQPPVLKICDFGYSKSSVQSVPNSKVGTPDYLAPEVLAPTHSSGYDGQAADVWSCGVMLYIMLRAAYPFSRVGDTPGDNAPIFQRIQAADYEPLPADRASDGCRELLSRMLVVNPAQRITIDGILHHPWFLADWNLHPGLQQLVEEAAVLPAPAEQQGLDPNIRAEILRCVEAAQQTGHPVNYDADIDAAMVEDVVYHGTH